MSYVQGVLGIICFILTAYLFSENKKRVIWKMIIASIAFQFFLALVFIKIPVIADTFSLFNGVVSVLDKVTRDGASFIFGYIGGGSTPFEIVEPKNNLIIAFQILPIIIVVSAISSLLFHWGILQKIIYAISKVLRKVLKIDGITGLGVASSIFLGIIESPLFIKQYLGSISRSSLFTIITAAMSTVAGSVMVLYSTILNNVVENPAGQMIIASFMSAPAAIMFAQIIIPESKKIESEKDIVIPRTTKSAFEAIINGVNEGTTMVIGITGVLLVMFSFISLINMGLNLVPLDTPITIQRLAGYVFVPFCWLMGIAPSEILKASELMGIKLIINEFVAYTELAKTPLVTEKSRLIMTYAMCGFANFGSLGILVGGLGTFMPERKDEVVTLSLKALLAGTLATMTTGAIVGLIS